MIRKQLSEDGFDAGPLTIQYHLRQRHGTAPGRSTIHRALVRRGFVVPQSQKRPKQSWVAKQAALFRAGGYEALAPKSKAPHRRPTQLDVEIENEIVMIRKQLSEDGFDAGPLTIQYHLRQRHGTAPGRSTIHRALVRRGFVVPAPQ